MKEYDLFLSHNGADKPWTEKLATAIEADRSGPPLTVFFDKWDIPPGGDIPRELEEGLQASRYVGLVLSPEALVSDWVSLERSTAIYRDPGARSKHLIPLLRRDCNMPDMLARLRYIDFRTEAGFAAALQEVIDLLRGLPSKRGGRMTEEDLHFREDAALLAHHYKIFDRPAFQISCIMELFIHELMDAIDDTGAAINTGSLYSRSSRLLSTFPNHKEYRSPEFKYAFAKISQTLGQLKRAIVTFDEYFRSLNPGYSHHQNFFAMTASLSRTSDITVIRHLIEEMDVIDRLRNKILETLNVLLEKCRLDTFPSIPLSSEIIKSSRMFGIDMGHPISG